MRYRIAGTIIFDPEERTLMMEGHDESVSLPIPACRLLEFMLERKDTLHERDALLREVWDKYGLKGSGSNLNQYISLLRRTLSGMNCEDFFITVPKVGFKVNPAIEVCVIEPRTNVQVIVESYNDIYPRQQLKLGKSVLSGKIVFYILLLVLMVLSFYIYNKKDIWGFRQVQPLHSRLENSCQIIYLNKVSETVKNQLNMKAMNYLKDRNRECSDSDVFIASVVNAEESNGIARSFLSLCRGDHQGKIVDCNSLYSRR